MPAPRRTCIPSPASSVPCAAGSAIKGCSCGPCAPPPPDRISLCAVVSGAWRRKQPAERWIAARLELNRFGHEVDELFDRANERWLEIGVAVHRTEDAPPQRARVGVP